ncbi:MAG TPA: hypothetical protein VFT19_07785 [Solirubrobacterales bacterium]|nr:hypothetical protein [Solirubrobacterales bacterium]
MSEGVAKPIDDIAPSRRARWSLWLKPSYWHTTADPGTNTSTATTSWIHAFDTGDRSAPAPWVGTGHGRGAIAVAHGGIWVANRASRTVARLNPGSLEMSAIQKFRKRPVAIAAGPDAVWAVGANGWLWRIWPDAQRAEGLTRLGRGAADIAVVEDMVWVLRRNGRLLGVERASGEIAAEGKVPRGAAHMTANGDVLWISCRRGRTLALFDPQAGRTTTEIPLPRRIRCLAIAGDTLYAGCARHRSPGRGWLYAIDSRLHQVISTAELPGQPRAITADGGEIWIACGKSLERESKILRVDAGSGQASEWWTTDWTVGSLAISDGVLLASMSIEVPVPVVGPHLGGAVGGGGCGDGGGGGGGGN